MILIESNYDGDFTLDNIPFGIISTPNNPSPRVATAIGIYACDLSILSTLLVFEQIKGLENGIANSIFSKPHLNDFMDLGKPIWSNVRKTLIKLFTFPNETLNPSLTKLDQVVMHLPAKIGDYTDFYASKEHATNVGSMFRSKDNALMPNWVHIPVGYHGRASSVVVSGTPVIRPNGMIMNPDTKLPFYSVSKKLDIELEVGFFIGKGNVMGEPIPIDETENHIFGMVLLNDWSSRDIQQFEYVPLGPFLGKNFATSISAWVITMEALEPFRVALPVQDPTPVSYLSTQKGMNLDAYDINLEVYLKVDECKPEKLISESNLKYMYWSFKQQLAHHTVNGCPMKSGDLCGSGTISGYDEKSYGSMLELSWNGTKPISIDSETQRTFLIDGDQVTFKGKCQRVVDGKTIKIGFGECKGLVNPNPNPQ